MRCPAFGSASCIDSASATAYDALMHDATVLAGLSQVASLLGLSIRFESAHVRGVDSRAKGEAFVSGTEVSLLIGIGWVKEFRGELFSVTI